MIRLEAGDRERLRALLSRDLPSNIFLLSVVHRAEDRPDTLTQDGTFFGVPDTGPLEGIVYVTPGGLCVPFVIEESAAGHLGRALRGTLSPRLLVGPWAGVDALWSAMDLGVTPRIRRDHRLYALRRGNLKLDPDPQVRPARPRDLEIAIDFAARMQAEELGVDPRAVDERRFRRRITRLVAEGLFWVLPAADIHGFQASASAYCPEGTQIEAVFTPPALRGRGYATRGLSGMCHDLLERYPLITLHVNVENEAAIKLYDRVGFDADAGFRLMSL